MQKNEIDKILAKEKQLQFITDASQDAIIQMDSNGCISFWNPAATRILGFSSEEVMGKDLHNLLTPQRYIPMFKNAFPHFLKHGTGNAIGKTVELHATHKEGHEIVIALSLNAMKQNNEWHAVGIMRDITSQKEQENRLIEQTEALKQSQVTLSENVLYSKTDSQGIITETSEVFCRLSGYRKEELIGKSHNIVRHPDMPKSTYKELWETIKSGNVWKGELKNLSKSGAYYWVEAVISPEYDKNGNFIGYVSIRHDITAKKNYEEQQQLIFEQSKMASMGEMIGNIAHQWRQPLSAISVSASGISLGNEYNTLKEGDIERHIKNIMNNVDYLSKTIDTFRDFIKGGGIKVSISLKDLINNSVILIKDTIIYNQISLINKVNENEFSNELILNIQVNEFSQVIINILNNAKDILKEKNIVNAWIKIDAILEKEKVIISIEDNAGGIPDEILPKIFEPYFTTKHQSQGTGLGLHMSYRIVNESLKGKIYAKNSENGAIFFIEIPLNQNQLI